MATEVAASTEAQEVVETGDREAIIFLPGIGKKWDDPSIEGVARRIATAIDRQSLTEKATTEVEVAEHKYGIGQTYKCKVFTIIKTDGKTARPVIDAYGLDYNDTLIENYAKRNLLIKTLLLAVTLIDGYWRLIIRAGRKSKGRTEKLQLAYGLFLSALLVVYLGILILAVVSSVEQVWTTVFNRTATSRPAQSTTNAPPTETTAVTVQQTLPNESRVLAFQSSGINKAFGAVWAAIKTAWNGVIKQRKLFPAIVALITAIGFALPSTADIKANISVAATNYLCLVHYLNWGERNHEISGKFESLIEHIVEAETPYRKIHVIGYSFGSIVALDNLFTFHRTPIERFDKIDTLVTIGCPFDIIRTYWPDYFSGREALSPDRPKWINVYSPVDILSSSFADGGNNASMAEVQRTATGIEANGVVHKPENIFFSEGTHRSLGVGDILKLTGFRAHGLYWGEQFRGEFTCFHAIVKKMYKGTSILN